MRYEHLEHLRCPHCGSRLAAERVARQTADRIEEGELDCTTCDKQYPIVGFIPRFVPSQNYAEGFGLEWTLHSRTQYDSESGIALSERRFFEETRWPRALDGEILVEPGSGSGRFTEYAASTGALVLSLDYSKAVEANYQSNGGRENVLIVQGDVLAMPFPKDYADKLFCFGMLQHTPDPERSFLALVRHLKPGGELVVDVYAKSIKQWLLGTKYWVRPLTRRLPPDRLYCWVRRYVDLMWPVAEVIRRIPRIGPALNWRLLIADYSSLLSDEQTLKQWAYLDTFDMLAPRYDFPQTIAQVRRWCERAGLANVEVAYGFNGIEARGTRL
jgi:SAM-dependent methyltransferase